MGYAPLGAEPVCTGTGGANQPYGQACTKKPSAVSFNFPNSLICKIAVNGCCSLVGPALRLAPCRLQASHQPVSRIADAPVEVTPVGPATEVMAR